MIYLLLKAATGQPHEHPIRDILFGRPYMHLYYLPILMQFIVLSDPLQRLVRRWPRRMLSAAAAVSLAAQCMLCAQMQGLLRLPAFPIYPISWFIPWTVFYVGGAYLCHVQETQRMPRLPLCAALWGASAIAVLAAAKLFPALRSLSIRPEITAYTFSSFLLLWALFSPPRHVPRPLHTVSRLSFGLYLSHPLVLRLWIEWTSRWKQPLYLHFWQLWLLALAGGLLFAAAISSLPCGTLLGGAPLKTIKITEDRNGKKT